MLLFYVENCFFSHLEFQPSCLLQEAVEVYLKAIEKRPSHYQPQSIYNMLGEFFDSTIATWDDGCGHVEIGIFESKSNLA